MMSECNVPGAFSFLEQEVADGPTAFGFTNSTGEKMKTFVRTPAFQSKFTPMTRTAAASETCPCGAGCSCGASCPCGY